MKKLTALTLLIFMGFISSAQTSDEENIKKTIDSEMDAWRNNDTTRILQLWQHNADVSYTFYSRTGYNTIKSWDTLRAEMEKSLKLNPPSKTERPKNENYKINTNGNMAWVEYDRIPTASNDPFPVSRYHNYRVLVKDNDQWKTISQIVTAPESYKNNNVALEENLNTSGYLLLGQKKLNDAIDLFKLNVKLFPDSWNTYDSLGEAYALAGDKKHAIENYEKSIKLNPKNESGATALTKLRQP